jgi:hypothetical protein
VGLGETMATAAHAGRDYRVPKRDLVAMVKVLLQSGRLRIASALPGAEVLVQELLGFQVRITASANDVYGAWREGQHDDLVLAVALTCWFGENAPGQGLLEYMRQHVARVSRAS